MRVFRPIGNSVDSDDFQGRRRKLVTNARIGQHEFAPCGRASQVGVRVARAPVIAQGVWSA